MKDNFEECLAHVLKHEGGFVNHPKDPGGMTNLGVTKKAWEEYVGHSVDELTMRSLTVERVTPFYRAKYWEKVKGDETPRGADFAVFDLAVNSGTGRAAKFLQSVVGATPDGSIGPATMKLVAEADPKELIVAICQKRLAFLQALPTWDTFGKGWGRRVKETEETALKMAQ